MKHRVTNFGATPLEVRCDPAGSDGCVMRMVAPGESYVGTIVRIEHGPGRIQYSVRPAERAAAPDPFPADEDEE